MKRASKVQKKDKPSVEPAAPAAKPTNKPTEEPTDEPALSKSSEEPAPSKPGEEPAPSRTPFIALTALLLLIAALVCADVPALLSPSSAGGVKAVQLTPSAAGMYTMEQLQHFDGKRDPEGPIYLAIVGEVFDVTKGKQHYGEGGGYPFFAGTDGSRAFVSGQFNETGLIPDLEGLPLSQVADVQNWLEFYRKDYIYKGKLIGHYYGEDGTPTEAHRRYLEMLKGNELEEEVKKQFDKKYPSCNSRWSQKDGGEVWCSPKSGGVDRQWAGVPRKYVKEGAKKCVCIKEDALAALDPGHFEVYAGCPPLYRRCKNDPKKKAAAITRD